MELACCITATLLSLSLPLHVHLHPPIVPLSLFAPLVSYGELNTLTLATVLTLEGVARPNPSTHLHNPSHLPSTRSAWIHKQRSELACERESSTARDARGSRRWKGRRDSSSRRRTKVRSAHTQNALVAQLLSSTAPQLRHCFQLAGTAHSIPHTPIQAVPAVSRRPACCPCPVCMFAVLRGCLSIRGRAQSVEGASSGQAGVWWRHD